LGRLWLGRVIPASAKRWIVRQRQVLLALRRAAGVLCPWRLANCACPLNPRYVCYSWLEIPPALGAPARSRCLNQSVFAKE